MNGRKSFEYYFLAEIVGLVIVPAEAKGEAP